MKLFKSSTITRAIGTAAFLGLLAIPAFGQHEGPGGHDMSHSAASKGQGGSGGSGQGNQGSRGGGERGGGHAFPTVRLVRARIPQ
jgi:hypothetical protein